MIENINKDVAGEIKQNGIVKIKNFLSLEELNKLSNIVNFYKAPKGDKKSIIFSCFA